jgi:hypothetical protein
VSFYESEASATMVVYATAITKRVARNVNHSLLKQQNIHKDFLDHFFLPTKKGTTEIVPFA